MRAFIILLVCLSVVCLAQRPQPCTAPPLLSGGLTVSTASGKLNVFVKYTYDALRERIRLRDYGVYNNQSFHHDVLLLFQQGVVYRINEKNRTCCKKPLSRTFHPLKVPENATLLGQSVLGSSSGPGQGVLVNTWVGKVQTQQGTGQYLNTVTEFGCIPVSTLYHTDKTGWVVTSFFNNVIGLPDPQHLIPPVFCRSTKMEEVDGEDPVTFFELFENPNQFSGM